MYDSRFDPFNQATLDDGSVVHFSGDESTYVWATIVEKEGPEPEEQDVKAAMESGSKRGVVPKATIEIGQFSADGGEASSFWSEVPRLTTDAVLATAVFKLVQGSVRSILLQNLPATESLMEAKIDLNKVLKKLRQVSGVPITNKSWPPWGKQERKLGALKLLLLPNRLKHGRSQALWQRILSWLVESSRR